MPGLLEEVKKKMNRPVPELPISEDTDMSGCDDGNGNGNGHKHGRHQHGQHA